LGESWRKSTKGEWRVANGEWRVANKKAHVENST
jgi:hypothetical protein